MLQKHYLFVECFKIVNIWHFAVVSESQTSSSSPKGRVQVRVRVRFRVRVRVHADSLYMLTRV